MEANESLTIVTQRDKQAILNAINSGIVNTAEDIASLFPITEQQAVDLLNEDEFYLQIANQTRARMRILYHTKGVQVLEELLGSSDSKDKIAGYDRLAKATGGMQEEKGGVNNFNFFNIEDLLEAKEKKEKAIETEFNRVKISKNKKKQQTPPGEYVNGNIFENENESDVDEVDLETLVVEEMFDEEEELEFDDV